MHNKKHTDAESVCQDSDCPAGKRNRYFKGKNMMADDFKLEQRYGIERRRLLNRAIHGWGVVYGFKLAIEGGQLLCSEGLALDRHGRELIRAETGRVAQIPVVLPDSNGNSESGRYVLQAHYAERPIDEIRTGDDCGCRDREWNHVCEAVVFSLEPLCAECPCHESPCPTCECPSSCGGDDYTPHVCSAVDSRDRGPHDCLCQWLTGKDVPTHADGLGCWQGLEGYRIAVDDPVPLGCVCLSFDECARPRFETIEDPNTPRRLVKNNDLLFDLIRGCDLTRIEEVSWGQWHRKVGKENMPWEVFESMFTAQGKKKGKRGEPVTTDFYVRFSAPVEIRTLTSDCVTMTVFAPEDEGGWIEVRRVPIVRLEPHSETYCTEKASICVDFGWCKDEIWGYKSIFHRGHVYVEIEIRGDLIIDCHGQAVDANAVGWRATPSGNGTPGGTYLSSFRVAPKHPPEGEADNED